MSISHADSTCSKLGTRSVVGRAPGNFGGRIWVPSLENMQPGCFGLGRMPRNPNRTGSRSDKLGAWQRNQDAPGKTNRHPKVPSLDDVLSDAAACSGVEAPSKTRSSTCSKLGSAGASSRRFALGARCSGHSLSHNHSNHVPHPLLHMC